MSMLLEAVAAERERITVEYERQIAVLDEIERQARELDATAAPVSRQLPAPKPAKRERVKVPGLGPALRSTPQPARRSAPKPSELAERRARLLALIRELEPASFADLGERFGQRGQLAKDLAALREQGLIRAVGHSRGARWHLTETLDRQTAERHGTAGKVGGGLGAREKQCREDVLATIRLEPGEWSEQRIADAGAWDREEVADACGRLLESGEIELLPDGAYRPVRALGVAA